MSETTLFQGPFFDYLMQQEPLCSAEFFVDGTSAMLFQRDGRLYRLTLDGCGHNFVAGESALGNPGVTRIIRDYGPVAPADQDQTGKVFYWLAEVEWLAPLDPDQELGQQVQALLDALTDGEEQLQPNELPAFSERCLAMAKCRPEFASLLHTLARAADFGLPSRAHTDLFLSNIMRRPSSGELVCSDVICSTEYDALTDEQQARMDALHRAILVPA
jgi:hypothetical protein